MIQKQSFYYGFKSNMIRSYPQKNTYISYTGQSLGEIL